jgi:hypothetical protein
MLDIPSGKEILANHTYACHSIINGNIAVSKDRSRIAVATSCGPKTGIALLDANTLQEVDFIPCEPGYSIGPWIKDGPVIAFAHKKADLVA